MVAATKIPLVFGITGHRDIPAEDAAKHAAEIAGLLTDYKKKNPSSPLLVLTSLAEGADRIAAGAAQALSVPFLAILPMSQADYETDFDGSSREIFRNLIAKAAKTIVVEDTAGISSPAERDRLYEQASIYVALHSHVLIALWNGYDGDTEGRAAKPGGTAATVKFRQTGVLPGGRPLPPFCRKEGSLLDAPDMPRIAHFRVRRLSDARTPQVSPFTVGTTHRGSDIRDRKHIDQLFFNLERFNAAVDRNAALLARRVTKCAEFLLPSEHMARFAELSDLRARFATADALAIHFRDLVQVTLGLLALAALAAFFVFELFAHLRSTQVVLGFYLAILILAWTSYVRVVKPKDWQGKYLDYRALAEALRVQFFWRAGGLPFDAADFYLRSQGGDLSWIRHAARICNILPLSSSANPDVKLVETHWIENQRDFFEGAAQREGRAFRRWTRFLLIAYTAGAILALLAFIWFPSDPAGTESLSFKAIIIVMGLCPAIAATIGFVLERRAFESHSRQYRLMAELFRRASDALKGANGDLVRQRLILDAVGREALAENGDWVFMHRERRIAPPTN